MRVAAAASTSTLAVLLGCGATPAPPAPPEPPTPPAPPAAAAEPAGPASEDEGPCASDAECVVGTPRGCCASWCPEDARAWARAAWAAYQADCAVRECASLEEPACRSDLAPPRRARCAAARCVLVDEAAAR
jgi:hypothetical protein